MVSFDFSKLNDFSLEELLELEKKVMPRMNKFMPFTPTNKQSSFMTLEVLNGFYGGAAGGGKSICLLMDSLQYVDQMGYKAILFRKTFRELNGPEGLVYILTDWLAPFMKTGEVHWSEKKMRFTFFKKDAQGKFRDRVSLIQFGYLDGPRDKFNYQGLTYHYVGIDEVTNISQDNAEYMFSRIRKAKNDPIPLKFRATSNPPSGGVGKWVYNMYVNPKTKDKDSVFLPAGLADNPYLDVDSYLKGLDKLDPVTRSQLRDGNWEIERAGNLFKREWFEEVSPMMLPNGRRIVRSWDLAATEVTGSTKSKDPDYTVGMKISEFDGVFYIEDVIRFRDRPEKVEAVQKATAKKDGYGVTVIEELQPGAAGKSLESYKSRTIFLGYTYKTIASGGKSKVQRSEPVSAMAERCQIKIVKGIDKELLDDMFDEMEVFPSDAEGMHDDTIDTMCQGIMFLGQSPKVSKPLVMTSEGGSYWNKNTFCSSDDFTGWRE